MCDCGRLHHEPETIFGAGRWFTEESRDNRFSPIELYPKSRAYLIREEHGECGIDVLSSDVPGAGATSPMTNVRNLGLPQWRKLA